jgi:hypothetical protein
VSEDEMILRYRPRREVNWELFVVLGAMIGVCISLFVVSQNQIAAIHEEIVGIRQDMKDFHGRLERQDAEFKGRMALIEERRLSG